MDPAARAGTVLMPRALTAAWFFSGAAALIDEIAAARALAIPLGADAAGVAATLTALLLGFALGGAAASVQLARGSEARRLALGLEAALAACALLAPAVLAAVPTAVAHAGRVFPLGTVAFTAARFTIALGAALPAAILMGATFPVAVRLARQGGLEGAAAAAAVYAPNTIGAAVGALACGFVLLPRIGYAGTFAGAAAANALAFVLLLLGAPRGGARPSRALDQRGGKLAAPALAATGLAGFAAFALEVALTRTAINVFGASTYALTAVLVAFLTGLSLGAPLARRASGDPEAARRALTWALLAAGLLTQLGILGFERYLGLEDPFGAENLFPRLPFPELLPWYQAAVSMLLLAPPALALGAAFPLAVGAARLRGAREEVAAGAVYAVNTIGCLTGTLVATFVLLPSLGSRGAVAVASAAAVLGGLGVLRAREFPALGLVALTAILTIPRGGRAPGTLFVAEGMASTVRVKVSQGDEGEPIRSLSVNGTVAATEFFLDLRLQRLLGHLPALLHPAPSRALVIGLGTGVTAGALATTPGVEGVDVVELEPFVLTAAGLFDASNEGIATGRLPNVRITIADGRTHLLTTAARYDVITCDPIHPWVAGAGNLYSRECFEQERARLAEGGVAALWLPLYKLRTDDLRVVAATFASVFESCALYITGYDSILVGAAGPLPTIDGAALRARFAQLEPAFAGIEIRSLEELMSGFAWDGVALRAFAAGAPLNTDARPILEYRAPLLYLAEYATEFLATVANARAPLDSMFGGRLGLDSSALERAAAVRARALERFVELAPRELPAAIREAARIFRRASR